MSGEVLFDGWCGEPIAWARVGEPVIRHEWTQRGWVAVNERLTPAEVVRKYGPIAEVVLGRNGGFKSVTYGVKKFAASFVDPRGTELYDDSVVVVDDPTRENYECPVCAAAPGEQCMNKKQAAVHHAQQAIPGSQPLGDRADRGSGPERRVRRQRPPRSGCGTWPRRVPSVRCSKSSGGTPIPTGSSSN